MKAILILDEMPLDCGDCYMRGEDCETEEPICLCTRLAGNVWNHMDGERPDWCPLCPMPERKEAELSELSYVERMWQGGWDSGWNACLDEIEGSENMILKKSEYIEQAQAYDKRASRAREKYQETGNQRYFRDADKYEDIADAMRLASESADENAEYGYMRIMISDLAERAKNGEDVGEQLIQIAVDHGLTTAPVKDWGKIC